jgi:hypothetical protein
LCLEKIEAEVVPEVTYNSLLLAWVLKSKAKCESGEGASEWCEREMRAPVRDHGVNVYLTQNPLSSEGGEGTWVVF